MNLKTFQADTMPQALANVRRELGRDAVILHTRTFKKGGFLGFRAKTVVEITATSGVNVLNPAQKRELLNRENPAAAIHKSSALQNPAKPAPPQNTEYIQKELDTVKQMVQELLQQNRRQQHPAVPEELFSAYLNLINQEVAEELAGEIIEKVKATLSPKQLKDAEKVRTVIAGAVEKMFPHAEPISIEKTGKPKVIALVGPTGVGKTTTIAKLAANFKLRENKSVGLITIDTYRIAAVDQLRTYANIINVPLRVVLTPEELRQAIDSMPNMDLILIDTAGRSQNDDLKLRELKLFLHAAQPDEVHLVLSTTANQSVLMAAIQRFSPLNIDHIIFTKLDEAVGVGMLLNVMKKLDRAISYITTGQNVPDDIEPAAADRLAKILVHPENWTSSEASPQGKPEQETHMVVNAVKTGEYIA
jgi:flagellar biosynthesis protein FlhF